VTPTTPVMVKIAQPWPTFFVDCGSTSFCLCFSSCLYVSILDGKSVLYILHLYVHHLYLLVNLVIQIVQLFFVDQQKLPVDVSPPVYCKYFRWKKGAVYSLPACSYLLVGQQAAVKALGQFHSSQPLLYFVCLPGCVSVKFFFFFFFFFFFSPFSLFFFFFLVEKQLPIFIPA
jgi:hypothetical protein